MDPSIDSIFEAYSQDLVEFAHAEYRMNLDGSEGSIELVEQLADKIHRSRPKSRLEALWKSDISDEEFDTLCKMLGGYVGEVFRKHQGGHWAINDEWDTYGIRSDDDSWVFPVAKAAKRLTNGQDDSLFAFYKVLSDSNWKVDDDDA